VSLSGTQGQNVSITSSVAATQITYAIGAPDYSSDSSTNGRWLTVQGGTTTPATLSFNIFQTSGLSQGTHTASVTLTPDASTGAAALVINVTYNSGSAGGGSTLTATPNPINVSATPGNQFTTNVTISTTSTTVLTLNAPTTAINNGGVNWLTAGILGNSSVVVNSPTTVQVTASAASLVTGFYTGSVTVTPNPGTAITIPVNFTVGGGTGNGTWSVSPTSIPFSYTSGGIFPSSSMVVSSTSGYTTYTATSNANWLLVAGSQTISGLAVGTSYSVSVGANAASLTTGSYTGLITIADPTGTTQATLTVTLSVNGGNTTGLTISPNPLNLTSAVNGAQQAPAVSVTSSQGGTLSVAGNFQSWIFYTLPSNTFVPAGGSTAFTLNVNPAGLVAGTYSQVMTVTVGTQSAVLTVTLVVGGGGGGGTGTVLPNSLSYTYQTGTLPQAIAQQKIVIPAGNWTSTVTTGDGGSWLQISPASGISVPDSASSPTVYIVPTGLAVGSYSGNVAITTGGSVQNVTVSLNVVAGPVLVPTPGSLVFVAQTGTFTPGQSVFWSTTDPTNAPINISATTTTPWITVSGTTASSFSVSVSPTGMAAGVYTGSITVVQSGVANTPYTYPVTMVVNGGGTGSGPLNFTPASLSFNTNNGVTTPSAATLTVGANVATNFTFTTSVSGNVNNWIVVSPSTNGNGSGVTTTNLNVSINPQGLTAGTYNGFINFSTGVIQSVPITLTVTNNNTGGSVTVNPTSLSYTGQAGVSSLPVQSITVSSASGSAPVAFTVTASTSSGGNWLSTSANTSNTTPTTLSVTANPSGLSAGTYNGNLAIQPTGGAVVNVPVTLTITAAPTVAATPTTLSFTYRAGDAAPAPQPVSVTGNGLSYTATAASTGNWLSVSPTAGTAPGTVNVSVNGSSLSAGSYTGTVTIAGANGATGTTTVTVSLTVTVPLPTITKVTNAASYVTGSLSPGEIITLFAGDPAHPIGPATPVGLTLDSTGKVATTLGGVQVLISGFAAPMIYASASQVSCVVPYELALFTSATVLVKYQGQSSNGVLLNMATTAPGLFTLNSSGTGPGAILNSNNSVNGPGTGATSPATRGDTVVVYLTGEGQTSPAGVTGKVTTVSSTPPLTPGPLLPVSITIGGQPANYTFAGEAPGFVSGVMQLNVTTPTNVPAGDQEILVTIGGNVSQRGVTVSLK
jgi:uncharacterized protein (TIGR03437 family)